MRANHGSRCIVHGTDDIADEGFIKRVVRRASAFLLHAANAFVGKDVGIHVLQSGRLVGSVEVDKQMQVGSLLGGALIEVDDFLIVTVHEVNLHADDTHLGVVFHAVGIVGNGGP